MAIAWYPFSYPTRDWILDMDRIVEYRWLDVLVVKSCVSAMLKEQVLAGSLKPMEKSYS